MPVSEPALLPRIAAFGGTCPICGGRFPAGSSILWSPGTSARHEVCPQPEYFPDCPHCNPPAVVSAPAPLPRIVIRPGTYTVVIPEGRRTIRIRPPHERNRRDGRLYVKYLTGSNNEADYTYCGMIGTDGRFRWSRDINAWWRNGVLGTCLRYLFDATPEARAEAGRAYAIESGNCYVCGRLLTVPSSIRAGIGPECAGREG